MIVIKRYPNRKLYDTKEKRYVTLDGIADLIRAGQEVQVLDHTSGEDLTAVTLTQIIFELEKKQSGFLPRSVLTGLVKAGGDTLGTLRRSLALPLNIRYHVNEEIERRMEALVEQGELTEEEAGQLLSKLLKDEDTLAPKPLLLSEDEIEKLLVARGVPTKNDIQRLNQQLDTLTAALEGLEPQPTSDSS